MKHTIAAIAAFGLMMSISATQATPIQAPGTAISGIVDSAGNYSVVHLGSNPGGVGRPDQWGWFQPDQAIDLFLSDGILSLSAPQSFLLSIPVRQITVGITFLDMMLDLNDEDGFAGGYLEYAIGNISGVFLFEDQNYSSIFNSSSQDGNELNVFVWGGDQRNHLGIDLGLSLVAAPEPGTTALLVLGMAGMTVIGRRRRVLLPNKAS